MLMAMQLRPRYDLGDGATLLLRFCILSKKSEDQLVYIQLNVNIQRKWTAMLQLAIMIQTYYVGLRGPGKKEVVGGPKGSRSVHGYPQTDGYNFCTMAN